MKNCRRNVRGYDPASDLADVVYYNKEGKPEGEPQKFLETKFRLKWFHHYLKERKLHGMVDDSDISFLPDASILLTKATVYIDGKVAGRSCSGEYFSDWIAATAPRIAQNAETSALGRALANAGFSTAACVDMPTTISLEASASQSGYRSCEYDPLSVLTAIGAKDGTTAQVPYLKPLFQVEWFQQYLEEKGLDGYLDNSDVRYDPDAKLFTVTATVYIEDKVVGRSSASSRFDPKAPNAAENGECPVRNLGTVALGRALTNAGFDVTIASLDCIDEKPCDGGIKVSKDAATGERVIPVYQYAVGGINAPRKPSLPPREAQSEDGQPPDTPAKPKGRPGRKPKAKPGETTPGKKQDELVHETEAADKTFALAYEIPVGKYRGKTIAEMKEMPMGMEMLEFYASDRFNNPKFTDFKKAVIAALK